MSTSDQGPSQLARFLFMHSILGGSPEVVLSEFRSDSGNDSRELRAEIDQLLSESITDEELLALVVEATDDEANPYYDYRDYLRRTLAILSD